MSGIFILQSLRHAFHACEVQFSKISYITAEPSSRLSGALFFLLILTGSLMPACQSDQTGQKAQKQQDTAKQADAARDTAGLQKQIQRLRSQIGANDNVPALHFKLARLYYQNRSFIQAKREIEQAIELDSARAKYHYWRGRIFWELDYPQGTINSLKKALDYDPEYKEAYLKLGKVYFYGKKRKPSFKNLNEALRLDKLLDEAYLYKGLNYKEMGDTAEAISSLQTAVELNPDNLEGHLHLGALSREPEKSIDYYSNAHNIAPRNTAALYGMAMAHQNLGETDRAIELYREIIHIDELHRNANYNLGYLYYTREQYEKALPYFRSATQAGTQYTEAYLGKGLTHKALGNTAKAKQALNKVLSLSPGHTLARENLQALKE